MAALDPVKIIALPDGSSYDIVDGTLTAGTGIQISNRDSSTGKRTISANINVGVTDVKVGNTSVVTSGVANLKGAANKDIASNTGTSADSGKVPALDANGKLNSAVLPAIAITDTFTAASEAAMIALSAQQGDICVRTDLNKSFVLSNNTPSVASNWIELKSPTDAVTSVNGKTGAVQLSASDVGAAADDHTHTTSLASDSGTSTVSLSANTKYKLTAGGTSVIFTTPADTNTHYTNYFSIKTKVNTTETEVAKFAQSADKTLKIIQGDNVTLTPDATNGTITITAKDTTYGDATTSTHGLMTAADKTKLNGIASGAEVNVQSDWNVIDTTSDAFIKNKPTIPTVHNQTIKSGTTTFGADAAVNIVAGSNVSVTPDATNNKITIEATDTTYESKSAASGGTAVSLVTTGEKYTWNHKSDLTIGTTSTTAAAGNHNHDGTYLKSVSSESTGSTGDIEYIEAVSYDAETGTLTLGRKYLHNNK